jgi:hypothetical protein
MQYPSVQQVIRNAQRGEHANLLRCVRKTRKEREKHSFTIRLPGRLQRRKISAQMIPFHLVAMHVMASGRGISTGFVR